ncbi:MAG: hypothetical protein OXC48_08115, partial [Endozoicomonadaceae bacterium]|nr:hypothetical protein [Endozoicomonadaceae bacterium]
GDVISILKQDKTLKQWSVQQHNIYSPYGMVWSYGKQKTTVPAFQQALKGFDNEITDTATGWQFLGAGHRTYNPSQRYFVSEDPAGDGYAFGSNNPIMNSDPSGNMPSWMGKAFKLTSIVFTLGMKLSHSKLVRGVGASLIWGAMGIVLGPVSAAGMALAAPAALAFASAVKPANKGLQQASMVTGSVYGGALFAVGLAAIVAGIGAAAGLIGATEIFNEVATGGGLAGDAVESLGIIRGMPEDAENLLIEISRNQIQGYSLATVSGELENGAGEGANIAAANVQNEMVASTEEPAAEASNTAATVEDIPKPKLGVFGCGNIYPEFCDHGGVTTFSEEAIQGANYTIDSDESLDDAIGQAGAGTFDEILQEYSRSEEYLQLGHDLLRPGGRMYVIVRNEDNAHWWLTHYAMTGEETFGGAENMGFIRGLDNIQRIAGKFGVKNLDGNTHEWMLVFKKPG